MKIGFLVESVNFGGGERVLHSLMKEMNSAGHEIFIFTWNPDWQLQKHEVPFKIFVLNHPPIGLMGKINSYRSLSKSLKINLPDCLIIFSLHAAEIGVFAGISSGVATILSERVDPFFFPRKKIHRVLKKVIYSLANTIVFQTEKVKSYFSQRIQKRGVVIPNMIMDDNWPHEISLNPKKEIVAVGRLSEEKNFEMLITAFSETNLTDYVLRIFGEGPSEKKLEELIQHLNLREKVILEGKVENVKDYIIASDIFVICSNHEGMPNALIEAMASGLACISTDFRSGGARALIQDRVNGILIPVKDKDALRDALLYLNANPVFKKALKENALKIHQTHDKKFITQKWKNVIMSVTNLKSKLPSTRL